MKHQKGFTAIELMVTIGVLSIMSAVSLPNMMSWKENLKLRDSASEFFYAIQESRMKAIRENALVVIDIDRLNHEYTIFVDDGQGGGVAANWNHDGGEVVLKRKQLPQGVRINGCTFEEGLIGFDSFGAPRLPAGFPAQNEEIYLRNHVNTFKGIQINLAGTPVPIDSGNGYYWN
jgi:type IV fimbrial biogenesis protein FimT